MSQDIIATLVAQRDKFRAAADAFDVAIEALSGVTVSVPDGSTATDAITASARAHGDDDGDQAVTLKPRRGRGKGTTAKPTTAKATGGTRTRAASQKNEAEAFEVLKNANGEGVTIDQIDKASELTLPKARRAVKALVASGLAAEAGKKGKSALYVLTEAGKAQASGDEASAAFDEPPVVEPPAATDTTASAATADDTEGIPDESSDVSFGSADPVLAAEAGEAPVEVNEVNFDAAPSAA